MFKVYIPSIDFASIHKLQLFVLTRPFYSEAGWCNDFDLKSRWVIKDDYQYTDVLEEASIFLIPLPINYYLKNNQTALLRNYHSLCDQHKILGYGYISGDFGKAYPEFNQFTYFRMGGFKSQLSNKNIGFPVSLSDHFQNIYGLDEPTSQTKQLRPRIGFCGHSTNEPIKRAKELLKCLLENGRRFFQNPLRKDWEPLFASAYERWKLLKLLEKSYDLDCRFIYRKKYRGGALTPELQVQTSREFYDNLLNSDYVLCVRGAGNFSVRLYETLLMGRIPIFVNTDCLLPLADEIVWRQHVVWIEWNERHLIAAKVREFHQQLTPEAFIALQRSNRQLWKEQLTVANYMAKITRVL